MLIAPLSWSVLPAATYVTDAQAAELAAPLANLTDEDPLRACRLRGASYVETGVSDKVYSSAGTATLNQGWYYTPEHRVAHVVARLNVAAGSAVWSGAVRADGRVVLWHTTGATLGTGSANAAVLLLGFAAVARASAQEHVADYACTNLLDRVVWDLASAKLVEAVFIAGIRMSPGGGIQGGLGSNALATSSVWTASEAEDECLYLAPSTPGIYRYLRLDFLDRYRDDRGPTEVGLVYAGRVWDTDRLDEFNRTEWQKGTWRHSLTPRYDLHRGLKGQANVEGREPGRVLSVAWEGEPGMDASAIPGVREVLDPLGSSGLAFVALNPTVGVSAREVYLCRFAGPRVYQPGSPSNRGPRYAVGLEFEPLDVRLGF